MAYDRRNLTTQTYRERSQMITGSLSIFEITLLNTSHKYWSGNLDGSGSTVIGAEYTVKEAGDYSAYGGPSSASVGDKFTATAAATVTSSLELDFGDDERALELIIKAAQTRLSIVAVGEANNSTSGRGAGANKVRLLCENTGVTKEELAPAMRIIFAGEDTETIRTANTVVNVDSFTL